MGLGPLVGRDAELARLTAVLVGSVREPSRAIVVTGRAGVGKTRLARQAATEAEGAGVRTQWTVASVAAAQIPLAPFAHLLAPGRTEDMNLTGMLSAVAASLARPARQALVVDDAHLLDAASVTLVAHLVTNAVLPVALTVRAEETRDWPWLRDAERLLLAPLRTEHIAEALQALLDGPAEAALVANLARLSQGNPLLLRELVEAALSTSAVARREGVWCLNGPIVGADTLPGQVAARLDRLPGPVRAAAELVALAEPVDPDLLEELLTPQTLAALEDERLLGPVGGPAGIGLVHPVYGEALRATMPPLRAREHRRRLAEAHDPHRQPVRVAVWRLDAGLDTSPQLLTDAARRAAAAQDHPLAGRIAEAAVEAARRATADDSAPSDVAVEAELALLAELPYQGRVDTAIDRAAALATVVRDEALAVRVARLRANLHLVAGQLDAARTVLHEAASRVTDRERRSELEMTRAAQAFATGHVRVALELGDRLLSERDAHPSIVVRLATARVRALACAGRTADGIEFARQALALVDPVDEAGATTAATIGMALLQALAMHGRIGEAMTVGAAGLAQAVSGPAASLRALWTHELGQASLLAGRTVPARRWLREAIAIMPVSGLPVTMQIWGLDALSEAAALLDDAEDAAAQVARLEAALPPGFVALRRSGAVWAAVAAGELSRAGDLAATFAQELAGVGALLMAGWVLHDAARLGAGADAAQRLAELAAEGQSNLLAAMAANAAALVAADAGALDAAAEAFSAIGCHLYAAESATRAATLHRAAGRPGAALAAEAIAARSAAECEGARTPLLSRGAAALETLTRREREVVGLAGRGHTDREIAERLHLSVRTVNSHLYRAYRKLGVTDRSELPSG